MLRVPALSAKARFLLRLRTLLSGAGSALCLSSALLAAKVVLLTFFTSGPTFAAAHLGFVILLSAAAKRLKEFLGVRQQKAAYRY